MYRYLVFAYQQYYPSGGWSDLVGGRNFLDEAEKLFLETKGYDYVELVDLKSMEVIKER